jgi:catechol 2,3-dioxygenase-like lactoylglutathione lyase family enzyme
MLDHVNLPVSDLERSRRFYEQVLDAIAATAASLAELNAAPS